ncbi:transposase [Streptomyces canus]|uniref:transposase n=1 Tax=Streptomyces canus TaxID=58343 RepID=UPI0033A69DFA
MGSKSNRGRRYSEEFKRDAVALVRSSGKTVTMVAGEIGVSAEGLRNWVKQDAIDRGQGTSGELTNAEREELRRLRRQNREQAKTIEVLRKAAVFFAKKSVEKAARACSRCPCTGAARGRQDRRESR